MSKQINPDINKLLDESGYDESTKKLVRQLLKVELVYINRSNYDATQDILKLIDHLDSQEGGES
jgi:hypothetical protein